MGSFHGANIGFGYCGHFPSYADLTTRAPAACVTTAPLAWSVTAFGQGRGGLALRRATATATSTSSVMARTHRQRGTSRWGSTSPTW